MNTSALSRLTTFVTLTSSGSSAPAWNTASCPAPVYGARRMHSFALFLLAHMILWGQKNLLPVARVSSSPARGLCSSGSSSGVSAHSNRSPDCQLFRRGWSLPSRKLGCFKGDVSDRQTHQYWRRSRSRFMPVNVPTQVTARCPMDSCWKHPEDCGHGMVGTAFTH